MINIMLTLEFGQVTYLFLDTYAYYALKWCQGSFRNRALDLTQNYYWKCHWLYDQIYSIWNERWLSD